VFILGVLRTVNYYGTMLTPGLLGAAEFLRPALLPVEPTC